MTNIISVIPAYTGQQVTLKNLDQWLNGLITQVSLLSGRISELESQNSNKDLTIANLNNELTALKNSNKTSSISSPIQAAEFWANKTASKVLCKQITKEIQETTTKKNNVIIFGLAANEDQNEEKIIVKNVLKELDTDVDLETIKINRFKSKNQNEKAPVQIVFENEEDKFKVLKASKKLKDKGNYPNIYINPDLTKHEMEITKKLNQERKDLNNNLSHEDGGKKYGMHKFGKDTSESKFFWGIRDFQLTRIKCSS